MSADDDVLDAESGDGELDGGGFAAASGAVRRDDVPGVPQDEEVAGFGTGEEVGVDARIGTGDEEGFRILPMDQLLEEALQRQEGVLLELMDSLD